MGKVIVTLLIGLLAFFGFDVLSPATVEPGPSPVPSPQTDCTGQTSRCMPNGSEPKFKAISVTRSRGSQGRSSVTVRDLQQVERLRNFLPTQLPDPFTQIECVGGKTYTVRLIEDRENPWRSQGQAVSTSHYTYTFDSCAVEQPGKGGIEPIPSPERFRKLAEELDRYLDR